MPTDRKGNIQIIFTFHYGSILIVWGAGLTTLYIIFTFHYGSILIHILDEEWVDHSNLHSTMVLF